MSRPLFSVEAEQSVLGALLLANNAFDSIADIIGERDFSLESHRVIWRHVAALLVAGKQADVRTLEASLTNAKDMERAGGFKYVEAVLLAVPSSRGIVQYARTVVDHRIERDLATAAEQMAELASGTGPVAERLDAAQRLVFDLAECSTNDEPRAINAVLASYIDNLEKRIERGGEISGLSSGLKDLDEKIDGFQAGDLIIIGGRPSMGKTALAAQIADGAAMAGKSVLAFSMEMSAEQWAQRAMSRVGRIDSHALRSGKLQGDDWDRISTVVGRMNGRNLLIDDSSGLTVERMRSRARRAKRKSGLDLVVIDYLQLMTGTGENRNTELTAITRSLKNMARELNVPVILLSQLSRECEKRPNKRPLMSDLRDSGAIEADADVIIFVYRDEVYNPDSDARGTAELIVRKVRMGAIGDVRTTWLGEYTVFENFIGTFEPREPKPLKPRRDAFID